MLKPRALKKRAAELGVDAEKIDEADDADDVKGTIIALIQDAVAQAGGEEDDAAAKAAAEAARLEALRKELQGMKPRALKKRAAEDGVDQEQLDEADDADDVSGTLIALIMGKATGGSDADVAPVAVAAPPSLKPHFGTADQAPATTKSKQKKLFGAKHCMFSYQWDVQEAVKKAREGLAAEGVPCWMDIDGGMKSDIFDSMAEGVSNAACVICFMSQKYQDSDNCALELKFVSAMAALLS